MDRTMMASHLSAPLVIKEFVDGEEDCNYEKYLLELVNHSSWFRLNHPGEFVAPKSESHGECDANNENYQLDFKLFTSSTSLRAKNLLEPQVFKIGGITLHSVCKERGQTLQATIIYAAFRDKSMEDLIQIRATALEKTHSIENDICSVLKVVEKKKNLLLFFPFVFGFTTEHSCEAAMESIAEGLNSDFQSLFSYREMVAPNYDVFLTCLYDEWFLLFQVKNQELHLIDKVKTDEIPTYLKLKEYRDVF